MNRFLNMYALVIGLFFLGGSLVSCNSADNADTQSGADADTISQTASTPSNDSLQKTATATITSTYADTAVSGNATFTTLGDGQVKLDLTLSIPAKANKEVAVHLHEHGDCGDSGMNSHGHWNPTNEEHGKWGSAHFHRGDIGNVKLDAQGNGTLQMTTDLWQIGGNDSTKNILDKAVIVHGGVDDYVSQPTGNAGNRIGCGVIK